MYQDPVQGMVDSFNNMGINSGAPAYNRSQNVSSSSASAYDYQNPGASQWPPTDPAAANYYQNGGNMQQHGYGDQQQYYGEQFYDAYPAQGQPVYQQYPAQPPAEANTLYAAASDVLGEVPPLQDNRAYYGGDYGYPQGGQAVGPYGQYPQDARSSHSSLQRDSAAMSVHSGSSGERPGLHRSGTTGSVSLRTQKSKAVDLSAPPYTKEYIDQYRQRIKGDPDPEAHFQYARYLIDAAKKIGANASDQRAVRKFREMLVQESLKVVRRLATQGDAYPEAQFFLANCYGTGMLGLQVDHERAYHLYLQAAKQNQASAAYRVAVCNEIGAGTRRDHPRAFAFYRKAASLGDTAAMYKLGMVLLSGLLGQERNPREAVAWLRRAAEQADEQNPHALHELGLLHEMPDGRFVQFDPVYARNLFTKAAQLGYTQSQFKLGQCYEYGALGCPVDPRRSIAWYTKAAEKGNAEAELALSGWYLTGSEGVLKQSDSEAYLWARRAANKGLSKAEYAVGYYAEEGIGVKQDIELAKRWYMRAAGECLVTIKFTTSVHSFLRVYSAR
jgi:TPR repeat protein